MAFDFAVDVAEKIVVGKVRKIEVFGSVRIATLDVEHTFKGARTKQVRFRASPTWACDESNAEVGERVMMFLESVSAHPLRPHYPSLSRIAHLAPKVYEIAGVGAGRFVIENRRVQIWVSEDGSGSHSNYFFPETLKFPQGSGPTGFISEGDLKSLVLRRLAMSEEAKAGR